MRRGRICSETHGINLSEEHVSNRISSFIPTIPGLNQSTCLHGASHVNRCPALDDDRSFGICFNDPIDEFIAPLRQPHMRSVEALAFPVTVQASTNDNLINFRSQFRCIGDGLFWIYTLTSANTNSASAERDCSPIQRWGSWSSAKLNTYTIRFTTFKNDGTNLFNSASTEEKCTRTLVVRVIYKKIVINEKSSCALNSLLEFGS